MIELRSDTFTTPTEQMRAAMASAPVGDDVYGEDPTVRRLEELAAERVGKPAACLMPSGTMANLSAIMSWAPRGSKIIVDAESDIYLYEAGGASVCAGVAYAPVRSDAAGRMSLADVAAEFPDDPEDPQFARPALLCLENTHNRSGGTALPLDHLAELRHLARERGLPVHLDGARVFNAALALGVGAADVAAHCDSLQFCLSKGLSAPVGSMLAGPAEFIARARFARKLLGGGMRQAGVVAAAGIVALETMVARLADDHANAARLARGLAAIPGVEVVGRPATNIVMFRVSGADQGHASFLRAARAGGVAMAELGHGRVRAVTHADVSADDIDRALTIISRTVRHACQPHWARSLS
ncbi:MULTISPECIES: low-specificity L-threonine aldolase [unclassified Nonomuraea]|uniref:low-specificity L-threonine aldolase n=1 Tax=unclassified Nonomuraea TaxID=2593643 RepID=UPI0035BED3F0